MNAAPGPTEQSPDETTLPFARAFAASLVVIALKSPQALLAPQFWAEDGTIFFAQQHLASAPLLLEPYAGYLNLVPRSVAWLASLFTAAWAPAIYAYAAAAIGAAALASLRLAAARAELPFVVMLAAFAAMPVTLEVLGRLTNVQWLLQFHLLGVAVACRMGHRSTRPALAVAAVLASSLTGPFAVFTLAGLAAAELVGRLGGRVEPSDPAAPAWWKAPEFLAMAGGAAVQATMMLAVNSRGGEFQLSLVDLGQMVTAMQSHLLVNVPPWPEAYVAVLIGLGFAAVLAGPDRRRSQFAAIAVMVAVVQLLATAVKFAGHIDDLVPWQNGDRYFVLVRVVAWWLLLVVLLAMPFLRRGWAVGSFLALLGVSVALANGRHLRQPALDDLQWQHHAKCIDAGQAVAIPIHPRPWTVVVPGAATGPHRCGP